MKNDKYIMSPAKINLIVVHKKVNTNIDIKTLYDEYLKDNDGTVVMTYFPECKKGSDFDEDGKKRRKKSFHNCLNVKTKIMNNNISMKFFPNGTIHTTGILDVSVIDMVKKVILNILNYYRESLENPMILQGKEDLYIYCLRFSNMNLGTNFYLKKNINQKLLNITINSKKDWVYSTFNPEKYKAVKAIYKPSNVEDTTYHITVSVFRSGEILFSGVKNIDHAKEAYFSIQRLFMENNFFCQLDEEIDQYGKSPNKVKSLLGKSNPGSFAQDFEESVLKVGYTKTVN